MMLTLSEVKEFLNVDFDYDDSFIDELILTSEDFIIDSIGELNYNSKIDNARFERKSRLVSLTIIQDCYDNRTMVTSSNEKLRYMVSGLLLQMKFGTYVVAVV